MPVRYSLLNTTKTVEHDSNYKAYTDVPVISIFNTKLKNILILMIESYETGLFNSEPYYEGSREMMLTFSDDLHPIFTKKNILGMLSTKLRELNPDEAKFAIEVMTEVPAVDPIRHIIEHYVKIYDTAFKKNKLDDLNENMPMIGQLYRFIKG